MVLTTFRRLFVKELLVSLALGVGLTLVLVGLLGGHSASRAISTGQLQVFTQKGVHSGDANLPTAAP